MASYKRITVAAFGLGAMAWLAIRFAKAVQLRREIAAFESAVSGVTSDGHGTTASTTDAAPIIAAAPTPALNALQSVTVHAARLDAAALDSDERCGALTDPRVCVVAAHVAALATAEALLSNTIGDTTSSVASAARCILVSFKAYHHQQDAIAKIRESFPELTIDGARVVKLLPTLASSSIVAVVTRLGQPRVADSDEPVVVLVKRFLALLVLSDATYAVVANRGAVRAASAAAQQAATQGLIEVLKAARAAGAFTPRAVSRMLHVCLESPCDFAVRELLAAVAGVPPARRIDPAADAAIPVTLDTPAMPSTGTAGLSHRQSVALWYEVTRTAVTSCLLADFRAAEGGLTWRHVHTATAAVGEIASCWSRSEPLKRLALIVSTAEEDVLASAVDPESGNNALHVIGYSLDATIQTALAVNPPAVKHAQHLVDQSAAAIAVLVGRCEAHADDASRSPLEGGDDTVVVLRPGEHAAEHAAAAARSTAWLRLDETRDTVRRAAVGLVNDRAETPYTIVSRAALRGSGAALNFDDVMAALSGIDFHVVASSDCGTAGC